MVVDIPYSEGQIYLFLYLFMIYVIFSHISKRISNIKYCVISILKLIYYDPYKYLYGLNFQLVNGVDYVQNIGFLGGYCVVWSILVYGCCIIISRI